MKLYINDKIKKYRKERKWTQEDLAERLSVSVQAVSRWETNATFPDIELLSDIANIFEISVDELLGVNDLLNNDRINELIDEANSYYSTGEIDKVVNTLREAKKEFPSNIKISLNLIMALSSLYDDNREETCNEILELGSKLLDRLSDINDKCSLYQIMAYTHLELGNKKQAKIFAEKLPTIDFASSLVLTSILEGTEKQKLLQINIQELMIKLIIQTSYLAKSGDYSDEEKIAIFEKINSILELVYEKKDYGYGNWLLSRNNLDIARIYADKKDEKNTYLYLSLSAYYSKQFDNLPNTLNHTSLLNNKLEFNVEESFGKDYKSSESSIVLNELRDKKYDFIRKNNDFIKLIDSLNSK